MAKQKNRQMGDTDKQTERQIDKRTEGPETSAVTDVLIKIAVYQVSPCLNPCQSILPYNGDQNT